MLWLTEKFKMNCNLKWSNKRKREWDWALSIQDIRDQKKVLCCTTGIPLFVSFQRDAEMPWGTLGVPQALGAICFPNLSTRTYPYYDIHNEEYITESGTTRACCNCKNKTKNKKKQGNGATNSTVHFRHRFGRRGRTPVVSCERWLPFRQKENGAYYYYYHHQPDPCALVFPWPIWPYQCCLILNMIWSDPGPKHFLRSRVFRIAGKVKEKKKGDRWMSCDAERNRRGRHQPDPDPPRAAEVATNLTWMTVDGRFHFERLRRTSTSSSSRCRLAATAPQSPDLRHGHGLTMGKERGRQSVRRTTNRGKPASSGLD